MLPDYFQHLGIITDVFTLFTGVILIYLIVITFLYKEFNIFVGATFIFILWRSFSSYYFSDGVLDLINSARIIGLVLMVNLTIKRFPESTLKALSTIFSLYVVVNFITYILFPGGVFIKGNDPTWLLGIENQFGVYLIPAVAIIVLYSWYKKKKVSIYAKLIILIIIATVIKSWSATAIVAIFFVLLSVFLNLKKSIRPLFSFLRISIIYVIIWLVIVRFNSFGIFELIITNVLGKDLTFSGRTRIWEAVFETIPYSLWNGYGINSEVLGGIVTYFAAHNIILQIILDNGIIGLFFFILCVIIGGIQLQISRNNKVSVLLLIGIFGILVGGLTESYRLNYLFLLLVLSYNVKYIENNLHKEKTRNMRE